MARGSLTLLVEGAKEFGLLLSPSVLDAFGVYLHELTLWNQRFNLTAITDPDEILLKHFLDSLSCSLAVDLRQADSLIDIGTGAGFPGLTLKIAFPHLRLVLLDSVAKRLRFLDRLCQGLGLENVTTLHARAEDAARQAEWRERFGVVTARAVAPLNALCEYCLPFAAVGGVVVAQKGPDVDVELEEAARAIRVLGGGAPSVRRLTLPGSDVGRSLVAIPKAAPTPAVYPRRPGSARKHPL